MYCMTHSTLDVNALLAICVWAVVCIVVHMAVMQFLRLSISHAKTSSLSSSSSSSSMPAMPDMYTPTRNSKGSRFRHRRGSLIRPVAELSLPPLSKGLPFLGRILEMAADPAALFMKVSKSGRVSRVRLLGANVVIVPDAASTEKVMRSEGRLVKHAEMAGAAKPLFGVESVISLTGPAHKKLRNALVPCFQPSALKSLIPHQQQVIQRYIEKWTKAGEFDAGIELSRLSFEIGANFVGVETSHLSQAEVDDMREAVCAIFDGCLSLPIDLGDFSAFGRAQKSRQKMLAKLETVILERKKLGGHHDDLLQRLLEIRQDGKGLTMSQLTSNLLMLLLGSFDTTAASLQSFMLLMCQHPDIVAKGREHVNEVLGDQSHDAALSQEQLRELDYIDQINQETMRFMPVTPSSWPREAVCDFELDGYRIPKGTAILLDQISPTRNPKYWDEPDTFNPDRFARDARKRPGFMNAPRGIDDRYRLAPFGGGSKQCIGQHFSEIERKLFAALLVRDYTVELVGGKSPTISAHKPVQRVVGDFNVRIAKKATVATSS